MVATIVWVTLGAFVGWIASLLLDTDGAENNMPANIAVSIVGSVIGGFVARLAGPGGARIEDALTFQGVLFSGVGAAVMLLCVNLLAARREVHV
ncbi:MAG: transglycosylase associated family protein [Myxococcaceae bacterium]|nr:transglycosylase associated family protein [Myxococcaceae bacterium]